MLTVVVTTYARPNDLIYCLNSVIRQTYTDYELLVIDDASPDHTAKVVKSIAVPQLTYLRQPDNRGSSSARNRGIQEAKGQFIVFLDDDDRLDQEFLAVVADTIQDASDTLGFALPSRRIVQVDGQDEIVLRHQDFGYSRRTWLPGTTYLANPISGASGLVIRTSLARDIGGFSTDLTIAEDTDLMLRAATQCDFCVLPEAVLVVRNLPGAQITKDKARYAAALQDVADRHADTLRDFTLTRCRMYRRAARLHYVLGNRADGRRAIASALSVNPISYRTLGLFLIMEILPFLPPSLRRYAIPDTRHA